MKFLLSFIFILLFDVIQAQHPKADFSLATTACISERLNIQNLSTNTSRYEWDFCQGDLSLSPTVSSILNLNGATTLGIDVISDGVNWYGFVANKNASSILRVDFGTDIHNPLPTVSNIGLVINQPTDLKIVEEEGNWYGFVYSTSSGDPGVTRINFGGALSNTTSSTTPITTTDVIVDPGSVNGGFDVIYDDVSSNWFILLIQASSFSMIKLSSLTAIPSPSDIISNISVSSAIGLGDVTIQKFNGSYFGYCVAYGSQTLHRLNFGSNLFSIPVVDNITAYLPSGPRPYGIDGGRDAGSYYLLIATLEGNVLKIDLGQDLSMPPISGSSIVTLGNNIKIKLIKDKSSWSLFTSDFSSTQLYRLDFPEPSLCHASLSSSSLINPSVSFNTSGTFYVTLRSFLNGSFDEIHKATTISTLVSPDINFNYQNICISNPTHFNASNTSADVVIYNWDFGDGNTVTGSNASPSNIYLTNGEFTSFLAVVSFNGCKNNVSKLVTVYDMPSSSFTSPTGLICTNNEFTFTNTTTDNFNGNLSYQWLVDNVPQSTSRDLKYAFTSGGDKEVKLITSIPGCSDEDVQVVSNVLTGPTVGFSQTGQCETDQVLFTNSSSGAITGYLWDFGNGNTSTQLNPTQVYAAKGTYNVSLKTTASNSCVSTKTQPLTIYSKPQPNFSLDLPPFSCSGTPSQFNDFTPSPTDSNLSSWAWNFGDAGASTDRNPLHTFTNAGDYNVSLTATTNFGCSDSFQKSVTIAASPPADFTYTPACINQGTRFTDASGSGVKSWLWTIGSSTYAFSNPTHVFSGSGGYSAKLTVTGNNDCVATVTKTINVPVAPSLSFSVDNACETQATKFKDTSPTNTDPAASWSWDFAGQGTSTGNIAQYSFAKAGSYAVKMTSTRQSGCVYALSKNVTINTTPVTAFTSSPEWGVPPLSVQFTNTSTGASSYSWHFNDKNNSTSTLASPDFQFTDLGDYVVDLLATSALGCSSSASGKISVIIPSLDLELKQLQLVKDPASNVYRIFVTVKNKSNYLLTSVDVVVDISGNALIKETINTNLAPNAEIVQLLNNQILPHGNLLTYLCASIEVDNDNDPFNNSKCEPVEEETVVFDPYPNPSNGTFHFQWIAPTTDRAHFEIFNSIGQLTFEQYAESVVVGLNQVQFDLSNLNTGAYYFRFSSNSTSRTLPIQIAR